MISHILFEWLIAQYKPESARRIDVDGFLQVQSNRQLGGESQERGGYLEYWKNAEFQGWPSETEEGGLLYYLAFDVNNSVILAADLWRHIASWAALLGLSMIAATGEANIVQFEKVRDLPERCRAKMCGFLAEVLAHEEAVDLISQGYFQGNGVLFTEVRQHLTQIRC